MAKRRIKFGVHVDHSKSQPTDDKLSPKRITFTRPLTFAAK